MSSVLQVSLFSRKKRFVVVSVLCVSVLHLEALLQGDFCTLSLHLCKFCKGFLLQAKMCLMLHCLSQILDKKFKM